MSDSQKFILINRHVRFRAAQAVREAPDGYVVRISEATRSLEQNAKLHAVLNDIAKQKMWANKWLEVEDWKRLITAAWLRATSRGNPELIPALDGTGFDVLFRHTSSLRKSEMIDLIEYTTAWAVENGIVLNDGTA